MIKSFIYPDIKDEDRVYGAKITGEVVNAKADWRGIAIDELQGKDGVEPSSCYIEAQQACIAILQEKVYYLADRNYSARFNALLSGGTEGGGDPIKGATSIKKDGLIPQEMMDWNGVNNWQDFHSWKGVDKEKCLLEGKTEASLWDKKWKIIFEKDTPLATKYILLKEALKYSPVPLSVSAWYEKDGVYYKPNGTRDNHMVLALFVDDKGQTWIRDTYYPFIKVIEKDTDFEFAMGWSIRRLSTDEVLQNQQKSFIINLWNYVAILLRKIYSVGGEIIVGVFSPKQGE